jgi:hypothetical protein
MRYLNMPRGSAASAPDRISNISGHAHALSAASDSARRIALLHIRASLAGR